MPGPNIKTLPYAEPYDRGAALDLLHAHAVPGIDEVDREQGRVRRLLEVDGQLRPVRVTLGPGRVSVAVDGAPPSAELLDRVRRWFDLDLNPALVAEHFAADPHVGRAVRTRPGLRVIGHPVGWEAAVSTVLGQHVSLAAARTFTGRLVAAYGRPGPGGLAAFPTPAALARASPDAIRATVGLTAARARTVHALAQAAADGLTLDRTRPAEARAALLALPGVGPWTVEYLAVRALGDRDAFPAGDLVLRRALGGATSRHAEALSQAWRPLRAYALVHLWSTVWPSPAARAAS